ESADLLRGSVDEIVDRQPGRRVAAAKEIAHVVAESGYPNQTRLFVENRFDVLGAEAELLKEIQNDAGIKRAWPSAHAQSVERSKAECRLNALPLPHRAETGAAAQVRRDDAAVRDLGRHIRQRRCDVLVRESVESVALYAAATQVVRQRNQLRDRGQSAMKGRIEAGDLRYARQSSGYRVDGAQIFGLM